MKRRRGGEGCSKDIRIFEDGGKGGDYNTNPSSQLLELSDEVILMILQYLTTTALLNASRTCQRLEQLCSEKKFWHRIDCTEDNYENTCQILNVFLNPDTISLRFHSTIHGSNPGNKSSLCPSQSHLVSDKEEDEPEAFNAKLTHLSLIRQRFDGRFFSIKLLPRNLKVLDLRGTYIYNITEESNYFKGISDLLPSLEELNLTDCTWVTSHALLSISKCLLLTNLSLRGCRGVGNSVAYLALASRFGFRALKTLDVTNTVVGSSDLSSISGLQNLEELYFGQYDHFGNVNDHSVITDQCLATLANSTSLKVIDMSGSRATDFVVDVLLSIRNMTSLYAHFTLLTDAGITRLRAGLPNCVVHKCLEFQLEG